MAIQEPMTIKAWLDLQTGTGKVEKIGKLFGDHVFGFLLLSCTSNSKLQNVTIILVGAFPDATDAFSNASIVYYSSKRYTCNQHFEKLHNSLFCAVYCWHFSFITLLFSTTTTDLSLYEVFKLFPRWPLIFWSFLLPPLATHDVVPNQTRSNSKWMTKTLS